MQLPYFNCDKGRRGGQSSGIIVMRSTGCPEEEVRAELYASIQGQGGARQGGSHRCVSSLSLSPRRVSLERGVPPPPNQGGHDLSVLLLRESGIYNYRAAVDMDLFADKKWKPQKLDSCFEKLELLGAIFFASHWLLSFSVPGHSRVTPGDREKRWVSSPLSKTLHVTELKLCAECFLFRGRQEVVGFHFGFSYCFLQMSSCWVNCFLRTKAPCARLRRFVDLRWLRVVSESLRTSCCQKSSKQRMCTIDWKRTFGIIRHWDCFWIMRKYTFLKVLEAAPEEMFRFCPCSGKTYSLHEPSGYVSVLIQQNENRWYYGTNYSIQSAFNTLLLGSEFKLNLFVLFSHHLFI